MRTTHFHRARLGALLASAALSVGCSADASDGSGHTGDGKADDTDSSAEVIKIYGLGANDNFDRLVGVIDGGGTHLSPYIAFEGNFEELDEPIEPHHPDDPLPELEDASRDLNVRLISLPRRSEDNMELEVSYTLSVPRPNGTDTAVIGLPLFPSSRQIVAVEGNARSLGRTLYSAETSLGGHKLGVDYELYAITGSARIVHASNPTMTSTCGTTQDDQGRKQVECTYLGQDGKPHPIEPHSIEISVLFHDAPELSGLHEQLKAGLHSSGDTSSSKGERGMFRMYMQDGILLWENLGSGQERVYALRSDGLCDVVRIDQEIKTQLTSAVELFREATSSATSADFWGRCPGASDLDACLEAQSVAPSVAPWVVELSHKLSDMPASEAVYMPVQGGFMTVWHGQLDQEIYVSSSSGHAYFTPPAVGWSVEPSHDLADQEIRAGAPRQIDADTVTHFAAGSLLKMPNFKGDGREVYYVSHGQGSDCSWTGLEVANSIQDKFN